MKLILNDKANEAIIIDTFNRNLDIGDTTILFNIYFSSNNIAGISSMNYLTQYAEEPITSYKILSDDNDLMLDVDDADARLVSFNESFTNDYYSANASIQVLE